MKQLTQLASWADTIISEATNKPTTGERPLPIQKDILYKASQKYPGYTQDQALTLWMADQMSERQQTDLDQNKLINAQRRENDKLRNEIDEIGNELHQHERTAQDTEREVQRLRDLSAKLKPSSEITQQAARASADELQRLELKVNQLQDKPGLNSKEFSELKNKVTAIASMKGVTSDDVASISKELDNLHRENEVTSREYEKVVGSLNAKEARFKKYIEKKGSELTGQARQHADEIKQYANIVDQYKDKILGFKQDMDKGRNEFAKELSIVRDLRGQLQQDLEQIQSQSDDITKTVNYLNSMAVGIPAASRQAQQAITEPVRTQYAQRQQSLDPSQYVNENEEQPQVTIRRSVVYDDPEFNEWMDTNLPMLVKIFKNYYKGQLAMKKPTYGDQQIAETIEKFAYWIDKVFKSEDPILSKEKMETFMAPVKLSLFHQPVKPVQGDLFNESVYADMLDNIIESCFTKKTPKK